MYLWWSQCTSCSHRCAYVISACTDHAQNTPHRKPPNIPGICWYLCHPADVLSCGDMEHGCVAAAPKYIRCMYHPYYCYKAVEGLGASLWEYVHAMRMSCHSLTGSKTYRLLLVRWDLVPVQVVVATHHVAYVLGHASHHVRMASS